MPSSSGRRKPGPGEPKLPAIVLPTPASVQEAYEAASPPSRPDEERSRRSIRTTSTPLSDDELKYIFSGAPHFILEKGARSQWHPLALFPWDESTLIQNLRDRRPLYSPAFTLSTLHSHLPPFAEQSGIYPHPSDKPDVKSKPPTFDIEVYEVPDMLSSRAKEAGCVGYSYFLESSVAPSFRSSPPMPQRSSTEKDVLRALSSGPPTEPYADCTPFTVLNRLKVIKDGPATWRRLGIRDCSVKSIAERIQTLDELRGKMFNRERMSLLDWQTTPALYNQLFTMFLYPPPEGRKATSSPETYSLKTQITVLIQVLTVRGAWIDFSLVEWRLRLGQVLWEITPHQDGDCIDHPADEWSPGADAERKWLLLQILLTTELILRIDAAVKLGLTGTSQTVLQITAQDVHQINALRTEKLDWDIICCRWLLNNFTFQYLPAADRAALPSAETTLRKSKSQRIRERLGMHKKLVGMRDADECAWDCLLLPRFPYQQLGGLFYFAEFLEWPDVESFKTRMKSILDTATSSPANAAREFASPLSTGPLPTASRRLGRSDMYGEHRSSRLVQLQTSPPSPQPEESDEDSYSCVPSMRGWMSRSWMTGMVLPGDAITSLLMSTVLENDPDAMRALGPIANLHGGFVYKGRSWWSTMTVVGRVLACLEGGKMCICWIASPAVPRDKDGKPFSDRWFEIQTQDDPKRSDMPRLNQGSRVFVESSPLGAGGGELSPQTFSLPLDEPDSGSPDMQVTFEKITLFKADQKSSDRSTSQVPFKATASAAYGVVEPDGSSTMARFILRYNVQFISSYTCLPPPGHATQYNAHRRKSKLRRRYRPVFEKSSEGTDLAAATGQDDADSDHNNNGGPPRRKYRYRPPPRLPGHPLHTYSYPYSYIPLSSLPTMAFLPSPPGTDDHGHGHARSHSGEGSWPRRRRRAPKHTFILDARGSKDKESFARAWCAAVGTNAVVGRVGRTCLACCIREARAVDVAVVIRVGFLDTSPG